MMRLIIVESISVPAYRQGEACVRIPFFDHTACTETYYLIVPSQLHVAILDVSCGCHSQPITTPLWALIFLRDGDNISRTFVTPRSCYSRENPASFPVPKPHFALGIAAHHESAVGGKVWLDRVAGDQMASETLLSIQSESVGGAVNHDLIIQRLER